MCSVAELGITLGVEYGRGEREQKFYGHPSWFSDSHGLAGVSAEISNKAGERTWKGMVCGIHGRCNWCSIAGLGRQPRDWVSINRAREDLVHACIWSAVCLLLIWFSGFKDRYTKTSRKKLKKTHLNIASILQI